MRMYKSKYKSEMSESLRKNFVQEVKWRYMMCLSIMYQMVRISKNDLEGEGEIYTFTWSQIV